MDNLVSVRHLHDSCADGNEIQANGMFLSKPSAFFPTSTGFILFVR